MADHATTSSKAKMASNDNGPGKEKTGEKPASKYDPKLQCIMSKLDHIEAKIIKLKYLERKNMALSKSNSYSLPSELIVGNQQEIDARSVYVGNIDYGASAEELEVFFLRCGDVNRVSIVRNKSDGRPKGFAFIEFAKIEFAQNALSLNETIFKRRPLKVMKKRSNWFEYYGRDHYDCMCGSGVNYMHGPYRSLKHYRKSPY
ncbi:polyadenylate-binding protein 2-like [Teleopsis dalmanni]|uniref:polyadenylate-binding protein 2-like n=1 Tax=Teleopsis dalmanni TaxID=139649 RepID=UPI0018CCA033|nr:polyadenylate-binding protein 2-like [Teleopsis dalmanni]